jgi:molecular chaperone GrpE
MAEKEKKEKNKQERLETEQLEKEGSGPTQQEPQEAQESGAEEEMVTIPLKSMEDQLREIDELKDKVKEYSDGWQRERADFDNYRKRIMRDRDQEKQNISIDLIKKYLAIYDDLDLAMKNSAASADLTQWVNGIALIIKKMQKILEAEGIEPIDSDIKFFDPQLHEAISHEENPDYESGQIIEVVNKGYKINNRVIRPALVRVAK